MSTTTSNLSAGDTAWMLTSTAFVFLMTPGLGFFYGGMVDSKNVVNTLYMSFVTMALITVQWFLIGYSFSFGDGSSMFGDFSLSALSTFNDAAQWSNSMTSSAYSPTYPQFVHFIYQCAFAVITPALISGAIVGRMKFSSYCIFVLLWSTICYDAVCHWVWATNGWASVLGTHDFAGGTVVHMTAGISAFVAALILGPRHVPKPRTAPLVPSQPLPQQERQYQFPAPAPRMASPPFIMLGTGLLWFGWMGFNAGSANSAGVGASVAIVNTNLAGASAAIVWAFLDAFHKSPVSFSPSSSHRLLGMVPACIGGVVGMAVVTPASGYVLPGWGLLIGVIGAVVCFELCHFFKPLLPSVDDSLDVFFCHGVGGIVGVFLTGLFPSKGINNTFDGAFYGHDVQLWYQVAAILAVAGWSIACTVVILFALKYTIGLRVDDDEEQRGLDETQEGEPWMDYEALLTKIVEANNAINQLNHIKQLDDKPRESFTTLNGNTLRPASASSDITKLMTAPPSLATLTMVPPSTASTAPSSLANTFVGYGTNGSSSVVSPMMLEFGGPRKPNPDQPHPQLIQNHQQSHQNGHALHEVELPIVFHTNPDVAADTEH